MGLTKDEDVEEENRSQMTWIYHLGTINLCTRFSPINVVDATLFH